MKPFVYFLALVFCLISTTSCKYFRSTAHFLINNQSEEKKDIDVSIVLAGKNIMDKKIKWVDAINSLQYSASKTIQKGKYVIRVTADNGHLNAFKSVVLDKDKWVFITYLSNKIKGAKPSIEIFVGDKKPLID